MSLSAWKMRNSKPQSAGEILEKTLKNSRLLDKLKRYSFFTAWKEIVGEEFAQVSIPEKIVRDTLLVVRVIDSAWAHKLSLQKVSLLQRLREFDPTITVHEIRFVCGNPKDFSPRGK